MDSGMWYLYFQQEAHTVLAFSFMWFLAVIGNHFLHFYFSWIYKVMFSSYHFFICNAGTFLKEKFWYCNLFSYTFDTGKAGCTLYPFPFISFLIVPLDPQMWLMLLNPSFITWKLCNTKKITFLPVYMWIYNYFRWLDM